MIASKERDIKPHFFDIFRDHKIIHAFSTRQGGFSEGAFKSLNLGQSTADFKDNVRQNRNSFFKFLKIDSAHIAIPQQIHSDHIKIVKKAGIYKNTDALITGTRGIFLTIQTADCFPIFIYDPRQNVCAIVHSGWRGTAKDIVIKTIDKMCVELDCLANNMLVAIGAGIQQKNYQVDLKTANNFEKEFLIEDGEFHFKLDIQGKIIDQLKKTGIKLNNIEKDTRCTFEYEDLFYSYRRNANKSGRMMGVIGLL